MKSSGVKFMLEEVDVIMLQSASGMSEGVTLIAMTDFVSVNVHSLFFATQHAQGCWRSHLHLARAQGAHDFRLDLGDLILLFRGWCKRLAGEVITTYGFPHIRECFVRRSLRVN